MRCRYCGAETHEGAMRCIKCLRRLSGPQDLPPVYESAAVPKLDEDKLTTAPSGPRLASVNPDAGRQVTPTQPALFPYREQGKIIAIGETLAPGQTPARKVSPAQRNAPRRKPIQGQSAFDFGSPAGPNPLAQQMTRRTELPVAPLQLRAMAAIFDLGLAGGMTGLFLLTSRIAIGALPTGAIAYMSYAVATAMFYFLYKLAYCLSGQPTLGLQGARLRVVSFDCRPPTKTQRTMRLAAGCLSTLSAGMGLMWSVADQERLSWHDHISQTFLTTD